MLGHFSSPSAIWFTPTTKVFANTSSRFCTKTSRTTAVFINLLSNLSLNWSMPTKVLAIYKDGPLLAATSNPSPRFCTKASRVTVFSFNPVPNPFANWFMLAAKVFVIFKVCVSKPSPKFCTLPWNSRAICCHPSLAKADPKDKTSTIAATATPNRKTTYGFTKARWSSTRSSCMLFSIGRLSGGDTFFWMVLVFLYSSASVIYCFNHSFVVAQLRPTLIAFSFPCLARKLKYPCE